MSESAERLQTARYGILAEVALQIARAEDRDGLLAGLAGQIKWLLDFERCALSLLDESGERYDYLTLFESRDEVPRLNLEGVDLRAGLSGAVFADGRSCLLEQAALAAQPPFEIVDPALWDGSLASVLALPLVAYGDQLGVLTLATADARGYDAEDITLATAVATHLALTLERWRQTERLEQNNRELARLASYPEMNPRPIIELDLDGRVYYVNPAGENLFGAMAASALSSPLLADLPGVVGEPPGPGQRQRHHRDQERRPLVRAPRPSGPGRQPRALLLQRHHGT